MPINWIGLEDDIRKYMRSGADDPARTPLQTATKIEDLYIKEMERNGREQFGNKVVSLPKGPFALALTAKLIDNVGIIPKLDPAAIVADKLKDVISKPPPLPGLPGKPSIDIPIPDTPNVNPKSFMKAHIPDLSVSIPKPPLPGAPPVPPMSISLPQFPSKEAIENDIRGKLKLPPLPAPPPLPAVSVDAVLKLVDAPRGPVIPNPAAVVSKVTAAIDAIYSFTLPSFLFKIRFLLPQVLFEIPKIPTLDELGIKIPTIPVDVNLLKMNAIGMNGIILTWLGAQMGTISPPPGAAAITMNKIISPGSPVPMKSALGGADFASEVVDSLKTHSKTVSGLIIGVTMNGSPITVPWVGIS